jgi:hypothetical protein
MDGRREAACRQAARLCKPEILPALEDRRADAEAGGPLRTLLDRAPVAAQDGSGSEVDRAADPRLRPGDAGAAGCQAGGPQGEVAIRPPGSHREGADGAAFVRPSLGSAMRQTRYCN